MIRVKKCETTGFEPGKSRPGFLYVTLHCWPCSFFFLSKDKHKKNWKPSNAKYVHTKKYRFVKATADDFENSIDFVWEGCLCKWPNPRRHPVHQPGPSQIKMYWFCRLFRAMSAHGCHFFLFSVLTVFIPSQSWVNQSLGKTWCPSKIWGTSPILIGYHFHSQQMHREQRTKRETAATFPNFFFLPAGLAFEVELFPSLVTVPSKSWPPTPFCPRHSHRLHLSGVSTQVFFFCCSQDQHSFCATWTCQLRAPIGPKKKAYQGTSNSEQRKNYPSKGRTAIVYGARRVSRAFQPLVCARN